MSDHTCEECGEQLRSTGMLGGDACLNCEIFYAPYGFEDNWEIR